MKNTHLPKGVLSLLKANGIAKDSILAASATDMNTEGEYADGFVVLSADCLAVLISPPDPLEVHCFKGYAMKTAPDSEVQKTWAIRLYSASNISGLFMEGQVASNLLIAKLPDSERCLTAFSNLHKKSIHELIRVFEHRLDREWLLSPDNHADDEDEYCPTCGTMYPDKDRKLCPKCMDRRSIFIRALSYFKPYTFRVIIMLVCFFATSGLNLVWPYLNGTVLYDKVLVKSDAFLASIGLSGGKYLTALILLLATMLVTKLTLLVLQVLQGSLVGWVVSYVVRDMKNDIFRTMGRLSISFFKKRQTGSLMTRVLSDAERVTGFFIDGMPMLIISTFTILSTLVVMFRLKWQMALVAAILMPVSFAISFYLRPKLWTLFGRRHRAERSINSQVNDNLTGARVVKAFGQENRELTRFWKNNTSLKDAEVSINRFHNYFHLLYNSTQEITNIVILVLGVTFLFRDTTFELGVILTFVGYMGQLSWPMNFMSRVFHWWTDSMNSAQRMFEILDSIPEITEDENPVSLTNPNGTITLSHVTFGYETNKPVLKDVNLTIPSGSMLGIVGRSGAGKTTLVNLISRMYDTNEGTISIDGIDVRKLSFRDLRRNVAMVSQETYIFMGTVEANIAYANKDATKAEIVRAAMLAGAHDFILRMPDGYDTRIGSSGRELSGGERQRISIARAILSNPKILILDEATASVDTETEKLIQQSINYLVKGRTTISIAHRLSTLRDADFLVVLDNGAITEQGTHDELAALRGTYFKLMELQTKALALKGIE